HATNPIQLRQSRGDLVACRKEQHGIYADDSDRRAVLAALKVLVAVKPPVFAWGDVAGTRLRILDLDSVGAAIQPASVGVTRDDATRRADVTTAIKLVMDGHRQLE